MNFLLEKNLDYRQSNYLHVDSFQVELRYVLSIANYFFSKYQVFLEARSTVF